MRPRVLRSQGTVNVLDLCRRQDEINLAVVVGAYVSQRGFIWKQRCRCTRSFLRSTRPSISRQTAALGYVRVALTVLARLRLFIPVTKEIGLGVKFPWLESVDPGVPDRRSVALRNEDGAVFLTCYAPRCVNGYSW